MENQLYFGKILSYRKANRKLRKLSPFENMTEKDSGVPILLKFKFTDANEITRYQAHCKVIKHA